MESAFQSVLTPLTVKINLPEGTDLNACRSVSLAGVVLLSSPLGILTFARRYDPASSPVQAPVGDSTPFRHQLQYSPAHLLARGEVGRASVRVVTGIRLWGSGTSTRSALIAARETFPRLACSSKST